VAPAREALRVTDAREQGGRGDHANPRHGLQHRGVGQLAGERGELLVDAVDHDLEGVDLVRRGGEQRLEGDRHAWLVGEVADHRDDAWGSHRNHHPELPQEAAQDVQPRRARGEPRGAQTMERRQHLLVHGLDRDRVNLVVARGLEQRLGIAAVGLAAPGVAVDVMRGQETYLVAVLLQLARPVMGAAARFEQHGSGRLLRKEGKEAGTRQPALEADVTGAV
jgi:hypothetical protein